MSIFKRLVTEMRQAQKDYCEVPEKQYARRSECLIRTQRLEKLVDQQLTLMNSERPFRNPMQTSIPE